VSLSDLLVAFVAIFLGAKALGALAERFGQPAVLGELLAGLLLGPSLLGLVHPHAETIHLLAELGVILLLFAIGLETDFDKLLSVGGTALAVAGVGVATPFLLGFFVGKAFGYPITVSIFLGATLTATSVGITARVLSDLGRLQDPESQIVLGAAVIDDILGLIILAVVGGMAAGEPPSLAGIAGTTGAAVGFVVVAVLAGSWLVPRLFRLLDRARVPTGTLVLTGLVLAFAVAELADRAGSARVVGAFAAGLVLSRSGGRERIGHGVTHVAEFFVPIFFVSVGAAVELGQFDPRTTNGRGALALGGALLAVGIAGKIVSGIAVRKPGLRKLVVGVGMIPRGEVGLIFARMGLAAGVLGSREYGAVALMVLGSTFIVPPWLRVLLPPSARSPEPLGAVADLATTSPFSEENRGEAEPASPPPADEP
jgi:Kef-type K+ transport system membrane component KefB